MTLHSAAAQCSREDKKKKHLWAKPAWFLAAAPSRMCAERAPSASRCVAEPVIEEGKGLDTVDLASAAEESPHAAVADAEFLVMCMEAVEFSLRQLVVHGSVLRALLDEERTRADERA